MQRAAPNPPIMQSRYGAEFRFRFALAFLLREWSEGPSASALAFLARSRPDLLLCILFARISDPRAHRSGRDTARQRISSSVARSSGGCASGMPQRCFWFSSGPHMLIAICWIGMIASILLVLNVWPRAMLVDLLRVLSCPSSARHRTSPATSPTECCWRLALFPCSLRRRDFGPAWGGASAVARQSVSVAMGVVSHLLRVGHGEAGQRRSCNGATSPPWMSTTRTARCPHGSAGMCSTCRTGFTPSPLAPHWYSSWAWCGCCSCRGAGASRVSSS